MKTACVIVVLLLASTLEAETNVARVRIENPGTEGRVAVIVSDENVLSVSSNVPGVVSGEAVTVEAPAPLVRLRGGSMSGDPLLEAIVTQKIRSATPRRPNVMVLPSREPYQLENRNYGYTYGGLVDAEYFGWGVPYRSYSHPVGRTSWCRTPSFHTSSTRTPSRQTPPSRTRTSVPARTSGSGGSFTSRAAMPKR